MGSCHLVLSSINPHSPQILELSKERPSWLPCVTSSGLIRPGGALFADLPSNVLGCFALGLLSPGPALSHLFQLGHAHELPLRHCPIAAMPQPRWLHQKHLLLGLRVGFCSSVTSYSGWVSVCPCKHRDTQCTCAHRHASLQAHARTHTSTHVHAHA